MRQLRPLDDAILRLERVFAARRSVRIVAPLAEAYRLERRIAEAVATARDGIRDYPDSISIRIVLARSLRDQGETADAREAFREVARLDPENMEALVFVESTPDPRWESPLEPTPDVDIPEQDPPPARTAEAELPGSGQAWTDAAVRTSAAQPPDARASGEVTSSTPEPVSLTSELAHLSDLFGPLSPNGAERAGESELTGIATLTLAEIYARQGLPDKAAEVCQQILAGDPDNGEAKRRLEEYERALAESR